MVDSTKAALGYSGVYYSSQLYNVGSNGFWWSSTVNSTDVSRYLNLGTSSVIPQNNGYKYYGYAVRCVAQ